MSHLIRRIVIKLFSINILLMSNGDKYFFSFLCLFFFVCWFVGCFFLHYCGIEMINIAKLTQEIIVEFTSVAMGVLWRNTCASARLSAGCCKPFP